MDQKAVAYTCNYIPPQWIAAHGFVPHRLDADSTKVHFTNIQSMGQCPYSIAIRQAISEVASLQAIILSTVCDQMRRSADSIALDNSIPVFLLNVPKVRNNPFSKQMYKEELLRLSAFLTKWGGVSPTPQVLHESIIKYNQKSSDNIQSTQQNDHSIPLAIIGGPLMKNHEQLFHHIKNLGGNIVLNATENGEIGFPQWPTLPTNKRYNVDDLVESFWNNIPAVFHRPNTFLYKWLAKEIQDRNVKGILFIRYTWCDLWNAEINRFKETFQLPMVVLDEDGVVDQESNQRRLTRIQALLEMIQS